MLERDKPHPATVETVGGSSTTAITWSLLNDLLRLGPRFPMRAAWANSEAERPRWRRLLRGGGAADARQTDTGQTNSERKNRPLGPCLPWKADRPDRDPPEFW